MTNSPWKVIPADCVLTVAVPHTREQFLSDLLAPFKDFVRSIASGHPGTSADFLWSEYRPTAEFIERVGKEVASLRVRVHYACRLEDLAALFPTCKVLTLVAHLHFEEIRAEEVLDPVGIARRLREPDTEVCRLLRENIGNDALSRLHCSGAGTTKSLREEIAGLLNRIIDRGREPVETTTSNSA
jgi:hypothetical protein